MGGPGDELSIDSLVALVGAIPASQPISDTVYQALFQLDGRACALLLKELSKAGLQFRCGAAQPLIAGTSHRAAAASAPR